MAFVEYLSDNGSAIGAEVEFERDFLPQIGDTDDIKQLQYLLVWASPISTLNIFIKLDDGDYSLLGQVKNYPQLFDLGYKKAQSITVKATESSTNKRFSFDAYMVIGEKMPERKR